jgi:hypothetical protein
METTTTTADSNPQGSAAPVESTSQLDNNGRQQPTDEEINNLANQLSGRPVIKSPQAAPSSAAPAPADVKKDAIPASGQQQQPPPAAGASAPAAKDAPSTAEDMMMDLSKLGFKSKAEFEEKWTKMPSLEKRIQELSKYEQGPVFASERAKFMYDWVNQVEGMEPERARQLLDISGLDLKKEGPDQTIRYHAFRLRPDNRNLTQGELEIMFKADELERYGDASNEENPPTEVQKIRAKQATDLARKELSKVLEDFNSARTAVKTPEQEAKEKLEYIQHLETQLKDFEGIPELVLNATNEKGEKFSGKLNFAIDKTKQLPTVREALADPNGWWDRKLEQYGVVGAGKEQPDMRKFAELVTRIEYQDSLIDQAYQQGHSDSLARLLADKRNLQDPSKTTDLPPGAAADEKIPKETHDEFKRLGLIKK